VDAFVCLDALASSEVSEVLSRNHVLHKVVMAMDTDPSTLEGIQKGIITATIGQKPLTMAFNALKMLGDLHHYQLQPSAETGQASCFSRSRNLWIRGYPDRQK